MSPNPARRNPESHQAILKAAYELARELGPAKVTIEGIAARSGVGKTTIYRWWPSKGAVLLDAINAAVGDATAVPDSGDVVADLRAQMTAVGGLFSSDFGRVYAGLIAEAQGDPDLARGLRETLLAPRIAAFIDRLGQGRAAGQVGDDIDLSLAVDLLYGAIYYRFLLGTGPLDPQYVASVVALAFTGLTPAGAAQQ